MALKQLSTVKKKTIHIVIVSVAILMVFLRPYITYQLSSHIDIAANPPKVNEFLQHLISKRNAQHAVIGKEAQSTVVCLKYTYPQFNKRRPIPVASTLKLCRNINTVFHLRYRNKPYLLLSRLQV